jgi:hypothetical protein
LKKRFKSQITSKNKSKSHQLARNTLPVQSVTNHLLNITAQDAKSKPVLSIVQRSTRNTQDAMESENKTSTYPKENMKKMIRKEITTI